MNMEATNEYKTFVLIYWIRVHITMSNVLIYIIEQYMRYWPYIVVALFWISIACCIACLTVKIQISTCCLIVAFNVAFVFCSFYICLAILDGYSNRRSSELMRQEKRD